MLMRYPAWQALGGYDRHYGALYAPLKADNPVVLLTALAEKRNIKDI